MKQTRKPLLGQTRFYFGIVMSSVMLITSCKKQVISTSKDVDSIVAVEKTLRISGEDWFKSIIYADGTATSHLPSLSEIVACNSHMSDQQWVEYRNAETELIKQIKKTDVNYFNRFKTEMESGDPVRIVAAIEESKHVSYDALKVILAKDGYDLDQETEDYMDANGIQMQPNSLGIILLITIVVVVAVAINLTYEINKIWSKNNPPPSTPSGGLSVDVLASEIANL